MVTLLASVSALPAFAQTTATAATVDILFAYTKEAAQEAGGASALKAAYIDNGIRLLNEGLTNSQTNLQVRAIPMLVEVSGMTAPASDQGVTDLLSSFSNANGDFAQVHKFRQQQKGDVMVLIFNGSQKAGKANLGKLPAPAMVTHLGTFDLSYIFPHEFAHILGCGHQGTTGTTPYAAGFNSGGDGVWRTIEANNGFSIPYFSAPRTVTTKITRLVNGQRVTRDEAIVIGDATKADCSRNIREMGADYSRLGDSLPTVTAAGRYAAALVDSSKVETSPVPFDKSYTGTGTTATVLFSATAGKTYTVTIDGTTASAPVQLTVKDAAGTPIVLKDQAGAQITNFTAFPGAVTTGTFTAASTGVYMVSTANSFKSAAYRIQIK